MTTVHQQFMRQAIALAKKGIGHTFPNPPVGAVIVKNGRIVGKGYHAKAGTPHAEVHALQRAGSHARGADLYVTLEPCCHYGRTPPCTGAILESGITRVIVGVRDPNPIVAGKGIRELRHRGISVHVGMLATECRRLMKPHVTCKVALSLDGKIATREGESKWITGEKCRRYVHRLRQRADAILVGRRTVVHDDPHLTVRLGRREKIKPVVVVDSTLRTVFRSSLFRSPPGRLIIATTHQVKKAKVRAAEQRGHEVIMCPATTQGEVSLPHLLKELGRRGVSSLLVEGGGAIYSSLLQARCVDRVVACIAPLIIGGRGMDFLPSFGTGRLYRAPRLKNVVVERFGDDIVLQGDLK